MYHDVTLPGRDDSSGFPGGEAARYKLPLDVFAGHLRAIRARAHRRPVTVDSLTLDGSSDRLQASVGLRQGRSGISRLKPGARSPKPDPFLLLTFDDGGSSAEAIADWLEAFGLHGR